MPLTPLTINAIEASALPLHTDGFYDKDVIDHLCELTRMLTDVMAEIQQGEGDTAVSELLTLSAYAALWAQHRDTQL
jgi:hypothetical protein